MDNQKYQKIYHLVGDYAGVYNYLYEFSDLPNYNGKVYTIDHYQKDQACKITFLSRVSINDNICAEHLSLVFNLLNELGLNITVKVAKKPSLLTYLDYLNIDYEVDDHLPEDCLCSYSSDDNILGITKDDKKDLIIASEIDIKKVMAQMAEVNEEQLDVCLIAQSEEEKLKASVLLNDLRLSGIKCDTGYLDLDKDGQIDRYPEARCLIILDDEDLQKGLILVRDNILKEDVKVPEDEIIDYMLGVI